MDEFELIDFFFKKTALTRSDVVLGIGDDAACVTVSADQELVISTDTLVANIHFLPQWHAYDIAWRAVMVTISDLAAMGACPAWLTLALTLPDFDEAWLTEFAAGLNASLRAYNMALIGGDTTRGPLTITLTAHGLVPLHKAIKRSGAAIGDTVWVSGPLGGAAAAVKDLNVNQLAPNVKASLMEKLLRPVPRFDLSQPLREYATSMIDISDGLTADLNHICKASKVGACLTLDSIPLHSFIKETYEDSIALALYGGDDYELCFTALPCYHQHLLELNCYPIGVIEEQKGLRAKQGNQSIPLSATGYRHF